MKDRIRQFEAYLAHSLEAFKLRHENEVTRIPRVIRSLTIAEFADKYNGDVNKALQAITKARMEASGEPAGLDGSARKRYVMCCTFFSQFTCPWQKMAAFYRGKSRVWVITFGKKW